MTKHTKIIKEEDKYYVLYAEETKSKEFSSEDEAKEWAEEVEEEY